MRLPIPPETWTREYQQRVNAEIEQADRENRKTGRDIEMVQSDGTRTERIILRSDDGSRWALTVDNSGNLSATSI
jgi:hypothetical protein